ncbi:hypothetical protein HZC20_00575, partial [Candidatus Peregrinibacteria bacterium]|nr:hypothetical protein [Candidatus Peregrinibacteria bacterium]
MYDKITVKWASSDPNGKFFKTLTDKTEIGVKGTKDHPVTGSLTIKYVGTGTITADLDTYNGHKYEGKACQATLFPYTNRCSSISLTSHPANPKAGDTIDLSLTSTTLYGTPLPPDTNIDFSSNTKGTFISQKGHKSQDTITAPIKDLPLKLNTKQEGTITAQINDKSPLNNPICKSDLAVKPLPEETLVCKELTPKIFEYPAVANSPKATDLKPNKIYEVSGYSTYSKQNPNSAVDYSIDEHYGTFLKLNTNNTELDPAILFTILNGISANTLTPDTLETLKQHYKGLDFSPTFSNVPDNQTVILLTYDLSESTNISVLRMRSTGFFNSECDKSFNIAFRPKMCQSLVLDTIHNGAFDPSQDSILTLKGDFADHQGEIEVKVLGIGTLSKLGSSYRSPTIYFTKDEIKDASTLSFVYNKSPAYDPTKDTVEIVAEAVGDPKLPENQCKSALRKFSKEETFTCRSLEITNPKNPWDTKDSDTKQLFEINVETTPKGHEQDLYYHWQVDGKGDFAKDLTEGVLNNKLGNFDEGTKVSVWASKDKNDPKSASLCSDSIKAKTTTAPQFKKLVYPTGYSSQADSIINIGSKDSSTKKYKSLTYALIFDSGTEKSVDIKESSLSNGKIDGNQGGYLDFTDMTIDAVVDGTKTILLDTDSKLSDYEDNYKCKSGKINLCIEGNFNTAVENFKNGKAITFNNIEPNTRIKLEFQAENLSKIDN